MEAATEAPQEPSDNPNDVLFGGTSTETDPVLSPIHPQNHIDSLQNSTENNSPPPNTTVEGGGPVSDSQEDDSSDPVPEDPLDEHPQNPDPTEPGPPARKRRKRKRLFTEINGNPSLSKNRRHRVSGVAKEIDTEAWIAISVGFPIDSLTEEEIEANVVSTIGGTEQTNYIVVRNHILARWRSNVSVWLTRDHVLESIRAEHKTLVDSAYNFLVEHGYINFGLAPTIKEAKLRSFDGVERANVVVVGAGLAGLVAARQLVSMGFKVVVLEGRSRPGGRVKTRKMKGDGVVAAADVGGSVLTGINGNPLGVLARQLGLPLHKVRDICPLYLPDGKSVDADTDSRVEALFNKLLDRVCKLRQAMIEEVKSVDIPLGIALEAFRNVHRVAEDPQERMLLDWHLANLEYANASLMSNLSMAYWDQDDPFEMGGDHCFIPGGNERFVRALAEDLPIFYGRTVESIRYGVDGVMVYAGGQEIRGDMVLCTVPLGVLKKGTIEFVPELPQRKKDAIQRLGFGLLNKVAMLFPHNFWGRELDTFGHLTEDSSTRGEFFLFYSYSSVSGGPLLVALVAGDAARKFELMSPVESVKKVLEILRGIYHPKGIVVPDPVQALCSRWGKDQFSYGSYSYVSVGSSGDDYDILAESVGDGRVFFAGEATNKQYPATMHGAFLSGMREAANMLRMAKRRSLDLANKLNNDNEENDDLNELFETPDLTFGSFSSLFDPRSNELDSLALLRVKYHGTSDSICLYGLISRKQAVELSMLDEDASRMKTLHLDFGVKLVGRKGLSEAGESLVASVRAAKLNQQLFEQ
ncbi:lysine-specific histone demethylase 1 homolog 1 [Carica papaya]|uniref:lysine-specific histone demethylase 1 homolog 1 n=1 Tax=Carica papaya TaxID=3649 RepID=UPI000B8C81AA|nr:lysine-specific histone demethylase 1 homolog 1 [Carica papaya]XP_021902812.1 lysine-specific histone demethylase 1 homolog 1 [Carica papaya]XP_021902813.1 lysine-specific histone demethylase 1 homolog 1 [Carica papaya]